LVLLSNDFSIADAVLMSFVEVINGADGRLLMRSDAGKMAFMACTAAAAAAAAAFAAAAAEFAASTAALAAFAAAESVVLGFELFDCKSAASTPLLKAHMPNESMM
jgi:hypothetical protein